MLRGYMREVKWSNQKPTAHTKKSSSTERKKKKYYIGCTSTCIWLIAMLFFSPCVCAGFHFRSFFYVFRILIPIMKPGNVYILERSKPRLVVGCLFFVSIFKSILSNWNFSLNLSGMKMMFSKLLLFLNISRLKCHMHTFLSQYVSIGIYRCTFKYSIVTVTKPREN